MNLPSSNLIKLANESIERAENYFNNQEYPDCVNEIARAKTYLLYCDNSLSEPRGTNIIRACELSLDEFNRFESNLPATTLLGDGYVQIVRNPQTDFQIDREEAEFLLRFVREVVLKVQRLE